MSAITGRPARRTAPMTAAEQAEIERQYRATRRKVDAVTIDAARAQYLKTLERVGGQVARAKAEGIRPDRRPEAIRKNADVINGARLDAFERRFAAYLALGYGAFEAAEWARKPSKVGTYSAALRAPEVRGHRG